MILTDPPRLQLLDAAFVQQVASSPDANAIVFDGRAVTFAELNGAVERVASAMQADGVLLGERVLILARNSDRYLVSVLACIRIGAVATPLSWRGTAPEIAVLAEDAEAKFAFVERALLHTLQEASPSLRYVVMDEEDSEAASWGRWLASGSGGSLRRHDAALSDIALQIYTSGTTGRPKGAMLSHRSLNRSLHYGTEWRPPFLRIHGSDRALISLPMFHVGGLEFALRYIYNGGCCIIQPQYHLEEFLDLITRMRPTVIGVVPAMLNAILEVCKKRSFDFSCIRFIHYGAAPLPAELLSNAIETIGRGFIQAYGMSETGGGVVFLAPEEHDLDRPETLRSAGRVIPGTEMRIAHDDGSECEVDEIGEILLRGTFLMEGYWRQPGASREAVDADGWLHTGDLGSLDSDGLLFIRDRKKEMIVSGGENVYPAEVENALYDHPAIKDVAVIGIPDDRWGEGVRAVCVLHPDHDLTLDELASWSRLRLAGFKVPTSMEIIEALPLAPSGKVLRRALRDPHWEGRDRQVN